MFLMRLFCFADEKEKPKFIFTEMVYLDSIKSVNLLNL